MKFEKFATHWLGTTALGNRRCRKSKRWCQESLVCRQQTCSGECLALRVKSHFHVLYTVYILFTSPALLQAQQLLKEAGQFGPRIAAATTATLIAIYISSIIIIMARFGGSVITWLSRRLVVDTGWRERDPNGRSTWLVTTVAAALVLILVYAHGASLHRAWWKPYPGIQFCRRPFVHCSNATATQL